MPSIGTCFRFYTQMRVEKKPKLLPIKLKTVYTTVWDTKSNRLLPIRFLWWFSVIRFDYNGG